jgi:putative colanic acid biosynthesis acetyltransferase WcaF
VSPVRLHSFDNSWYTPGRSLPYQLAWFFLGLPLLRSALIPSSAFRVRLLRFFGASVGDGVVIKPGVRVKYPWRLTIGNDCWLGEDCWIDNLADVQIGSNVCISQGAYFCTGNHDWTDPAFGLIVKPITLHDGSWAGAKSVLAPGVTLGECSIASAGSVVTKDIPPFEIHGGNPAVFVKRRRIESQRFDMELQTSERVAS